MDNDGITIGYEEHEPMKRHTIWEFKNEEQCIWNKAKKTTCRTTRQTRSHKLWCRPYQRSRLGQPIEVKVSKPHGMGCNAKLPQHASNEKSEIHQRIQRSFTCLQTFQPLEKKAVEPFHISPGNNANTRKNIIPSLGWVGKNPKKACVLDLNLSPSWSKRKSARVFFRCKFGTIFNVFLIMKVAPSKRHIQRRVSKGTYIYSFSEQK